MLTLFVRPLLVAVVLLPLTVRAVTLGEARVKSYLNQPLDAEIQVIGLAPGQHEDIRLRLANQAQFDRLGIVYQSYLNDLQFDIVGTDDNWVVRARSRRPITEPFIDFPLQMSWRGGQMIRQYTLLLDPPAVIRTATRTARPDSGRIPAQPPASDPRPAVSSSYGPVQRGETLWPIAERLRPTGITTRQMAMALLRANPQAFIDGNINRLRAGAVLQIPPRSFVEQLDAATARREFAAQTQRRQPPVSASPRQPPAAATPPPAPVAATPAPAAVASGQSEAADPQLRIVTEEPTPRGENRDEQSLNDRLLVTMEEIESNRITTNAIESRLARLEDELSRMQQLVELKDAQIAALQSEVKAREAIAEAAQAAAAAAAGTSATIDSQAPQPAVTPAPAPAAAIAAEPIRPVQAQDPQPWYRPHLWVIWAILGLLGITALLMMFRRQQATNPDLLTSDLPATDGAASAPYAAKAQPVPTAHAVAEPEPPTETEPRPPETATPVSSVPDRVPDADAAESDTSAEATDVEQQIEGLTNSLLDEMLEEHKHLDQRPAPAGDASALETELSDEDIASWVEDLDFEGTTDQSAAETSDGARPIADDDIPSILTELDDQLSASDTTLSREPAPIELDPVDEISEDDAFSMSLDLARAYLEIGDQEGARDMLKQALSGARDPEHRRQIEELLQHID